MRIGELASAAGVAPSALRYYEEAGLLEAAARTESGYRIYEPAALGRVQFIQRAQALGLSVREIRRLVDGPRVDGADERRALRHVVAHKLAETKSRANCSGSARSLRPYTYGSIASQDLTADTSATAVLAAH